MKNNKGILTIEASLVLTFFVMFMLFFFSFGRIYRAQSVVSHGVLQAADAISTESFVRENISEEDLSDFLYVSNHLYGGESISSDALKSLKKVNFKKLAKDKFTAVVAEDSGKADTVLKNVGVKNGIEGVDFSKSKLDEKTGESIVFADYTVELQFPLFGIREIKLTKAAKVRNMGAESYLIEVRSANKEQGSTSGNTKVRKNGSTVISANPEWGYKFVKWQDGSTQNPRTISNVNSDMQFVAYFAKQGYGVKVNIKPAGAGNVAGVGTYELNDIITLVAKENEGYLFDYWEDTGSNEKDRQVRVENDITLTAVFKRAPSIEIKNTPYSMTTDWPGHIHVGMSYGSNNYIQNQERARLINNYLSSFSLDVSVKGADGEKVVYKSSNTSVAQVNSQGLVTLTGPGEATVTASVTVDGVTYTSTAKVSSRRLMENYYVRNSNAWPYGNGGRYYLAGNWNGARGSNHKTFGAHYRILLFDDLANQTVIYPGETTSGKLSIKSTTGNNNRIMHGTNGSNMTGYVIHPGGADGDYVFFPVPEKPYALKSLTITK